MNLTYINSILSGTLLLLVIWQTVRLIKLDRIRKEFFSSGLKKNLEQILVDQNRSLTQISQDLRHLDENLTRLYKDNRHNLQKVGFIRFNPFDDAGGNISFALALLDGDDNGAVISSLHGREGTRMYAKAIKGGVSESKLTEEETHAIKDAK